MDGSLNSQSGPPSMSSPWPSSELARGPHEQHSVLGIFSLPLELDNVHTPPSPGRHSLLQEDFPDL